MPNIKELLALIDAIEEEEMQIQAEEDNRYLNIAIDEDLEESLWE